MEIIKPFIQKIQNLLNEVKDHKYNKYRGRANKELSKLFRSKFKNVDTDKYIIFEALWDNPHHWLRLSIFGPVISNHLKSRIIGLYEKSTSKKAINSLKAFNFTDYIEIKAQVSNENLLQAKAILDDFGTSKDFSNLKLPYNFPWQFLYDSILKSEMIGSLDSSYKKNYIYIAKLISYLEEYEKKINWEKISGLVISHPVNFRFSTLTFLALSKGIPVYVLNYVNEYISIRKLDSIDDWTGGSYEKPDFNVVSKLPKYKKEFLASVGRDYLNQVRSAKKGEVSTVGTFRTEKDKNFNKNQFLNNLYLDIKKPTVVVMTGCWPDFPNLYPPSWYTDYVDWTKKTLDIIKDDNNCNWIIKPHPAEFKYGSKTKIEDFLGNIKNSNIVIWPKEVLSNHLIEIADLVLTSHGSAGVEYPALGKPAIISRETHFSKWGFVNCCLTFDKYSYMLRNIKSIIKPDLESQKYAYIYIATSICNASNISKDYLFEMGSKSKKLWPSIEKFISINSKNIDLEQNMMKKWLNSNIQSYNFFKSINYDTWEVD